MQTNLSDWDWDNTKICINLQKRYDEHGRIHNVIKNYNNFQSMPKFKNRTTNRGDWSEENMKRAIQAVLDKKCSERAAADRYEVPRTSLQDRIKGIKQGHQIILKPKFGRFHQT